MAMIINKKNHRNIKSYTKFKLHEIIAWILVFFLASLIIHHHYTSPKVIFHGGSPTSTQEHKGSCWCGATDNYCMCTPSVAIDLIITDADIEYVWLVRRRDTSQLATMGGFVKVGDSVEETVKRELKEETGLDLMDNTPTLFGVYSDSTRDKRRHTVSAVYVATIPLHQLPYAGDDVKDVVKISLEDVFHMEDDQFFGDHKTVLMDFYWKLEEKNAVQKESFEWNQIQRSLC